MLESFTVKNIENCQHFSTNESLNTQSIINHHNSQSPISVLYERTCIEQEDENAGLYHLHVGKIEQKKMEHTKKNIYGQ